MANFTQTLSDSIRFFSPSTNFGSPMTWGTDSWGNDFGTSGNFGIPTNSIIRHQDFGPTLIDQFGVPLFITINSALQFSQGPGQAEYLMDHSGQYFYVLGGGFTNDESVTNPSYLVSPSPSTPWSLLTNSSTTWVTS